VVQKLQYKFLLKCNSYEIILKKFYFNAITQVYRIKFYYLVATYNSSMAVKFNIFLKKPEYVRFITCSRSEKITSLPNPFLLHSKSKRLHVSIDLLVILFAAGK
ncbi:MAG: hypothetical protein ACRD5J_02360, partial [Nitrososphaeraceae archaeon]